MMSAKDLLLSQDAKLKTQQKELDDKTKHIISFLESTSNQRLNMEKQKLIHDFESYVSTAKYNEKQNRSFDIIKEYENYKQITDIYFHN